LEPHGTAWSGASPSIKPARTMAILLTGDQ
jgi:hypothetical protein